MQGYVDILHPLCTLKWIREGKVKRMKTSEYVQAIVLNSKVYICSRDNIVIYVSAAADLKTWDVIPLPDTQHFALTSYCSQLVLAGGWNNSSTDPDVYNDLWVSADGTNWAQSLPPMPTSRYGATAVNTGTPECIIVLGGCGKDCKMVDTVEVLLEGEWSSLQPLPMPCDFMRSTLHCGYLYCYKKKRRWYCKLESLLATCTSVGGGLVWHAMNWPFADPLLLSSGAHLLVFSDLDMHVYSPHARCWIHVADTPSGIGTVVAAVACTSGEIVVSRYTWHKYIFRLTWKSKYDRFL